MAVEKLEVFKNNLKIYPLSPNTNLYINYFIFVLKNGQIMDVAIKKLQIYVNDNDMETSEHDIIVKRFIYEASKCKWMLKVTFFSHLFPTAD